MHLKKWVTQLLKTSPLLSNTGVRSELVIEWWMPGEKHHRRIYRHHSPTNAGFAATAGLFCGSGGLAAFTYLELGTGSTAFDVTQTALITPVTDTGLARHAAAVTLVQTTVANDTANLDYTWTATGVKILREIGIFNAASGVTMADRTVFDAITTADTMQVHMTYKEKFSA